MVYCDGWTKKMIIEHTEVEGQSKDKGGVKLLETWLNCRKRKRSRFIPLCPFAKRLSLESWEDLQEVLNERFERNNRIFSNDASDLTFLAYLAETAKSRHARQVEATPANVEESMTDDW